MYKRIKHQLGALVRDDTYSSCVRRGDDVAFMTNVARVRYVYCPTRPSYQSSSSTHKASITIQHHRPL
ncbi:hypothetical protein L1887_07894 [Cichorium endivia]|nr:hypothetical protein L1887_07894 [Cichorium endivia]